MNERPSRTISDELAAVLFAVELGRRGTGAVTRELTRAIVRWAHSRGWSARTEAPVQPALAGPSGFGYVDVLIRRGPALADVAVEIDSTDKPWSLAKLRHAALGGMHAIWIRWGDDKWAGAFDEVDVIQLPALRRTTPRAVQPGQLTFWT